MDACEACGRTTVRLYVVRRSRFWESPGPLHTYCLRDRLFRAIAGFFAWVFHASAYGP